MALAPALQLFDVVSSPCEKAFVQRLHQLSKQCFFTLTALVHFAPCTRSLDLLLACILCIFSKYDEHIVFSRMYCELKAQFYLIPLMFYSTSSKKAILINLLCFPLIPYLYSRTETILTVTARVCESLKSCYILFLKEIFLYYLLTLF